MWRCHLLKEPKVSSEGGVKPEQHWNTGRILALVACLVAAGITGGASIHIATNEAKFPWVPVIQFVGSLLAGLGTLTYKNPVGKKED